MYTRTRTKRKKDRDKRRRNKRRDPQMTPIDSVIMNNREKDVDPDDPEEIQRAIMNELNQHDALFLTPSPI
jgi:hypothetical protein